MKTILFDLFEAQPAGTSKYHGGGEYIKTIYKYFIDKFLEKCNLIVFYDKERFIDDWIIDSFEEKDILAITISERKEISRIFSEYRIDIFYSGIPYYYRKDWIPEYVIIKGTIHGLRDIEMPCDLYSYKYFTGKKRVTHKVKYLWREKIRKRNISNFSNCIYLLDEIVCVSDHTKYSLLNTYPDLLNKKIYTFYTPQKFIAEEYLKNNAMNNNYGKYILMLGGDRWIKNIYREMKALKKLLDNNYLDEYKVIIVGGVPAQIISEFNENKDQFEYLGYVDSLMLECLYENCDLFLYASLNEGFGMPPLEAMKYGKTCVVSGACSLPEICGDAVYYVNPYDVNEIATRIIEATYNKMPIDLVKARFKEILNKQLKDIDGICRFIIK